MIRGRRPGTCRLGIAPSTAVIMSSVSGPASLVRWDAVRVSGGVSGVVVVSAGTRWGSWVGCGGADTSVASVTSGVSVIGEHPVVVTSIATAGIGEHSEECV